MVSRLQQEYTQFEATDLDLEFHHALCRISGHSRVFAAWTALRAQVRLLILTHRILQPLDFRENSAEWHRHVVTALRQRDVNQAREVLRTHLAVSFESVVEAIKQGKAEAAEST
jgi:DNA-binding GntR family transcriptional regulator